MELTDDIKAKLLLLNVLPVCGECQHYIRHFVWRDDAEASCELEMKKDKDVKYFGSACNEFQIYKA